MAGWEMFRKRRVAKEQVSVVCVIDNQKLIAKIFTIQYSFNKGFDINLIFVDPRNFKPLANFVVCILKSGVINGWDLKDTVFQICVVDPKDRLQSNLSFSDTPKTLKDD